MPVTIICPICGKKKVCTPSQAKTRRTCSRECSKKWMSELHKGENAPNWKGLTVTTQCAQCGKTLRRNKSRVENYENNFCNKECYGQWLSENNVGKNHHNWQGIKVKCENCGKSVIRVKNQYKRSNRFFCNRKCYFEWMQNKFGKSTTPKYYGPNWIEQKDKARERDKYTCQHCDITEGELGHSLDVHHIRPFKAFNFIPYKNNNYSEANELENLISLCHSCHVKLFYE